jgi:mono/diheme cytochrome c family protein
MRPLTASLSLVAVLAGGVPGHVAGQDGGVVSAVEYEGWRQYSVHCARCHGQDALPNPVTANLLVSMAPGGPAADKATFTKVVAGGRPERGMPPFNDIVTPEQIDAIHAYLTGRAETRIPAGRPKQPAEPAKKETPG